jgi:hypothetical protein
MDVGALIEEIELFGVAFALERHNGESGEYEICVWFPNWEVRDATEELVDLLRPARRKQQVIEFLLARSSTPAEMPAIQVAVGPPAIGSGGEHPDPEETSWCGEHAGLLKLQERDLALLLGDETIISSEGLADQDVVRDTGEAR